MQIDSAVRTGETKAQYRERMLAEFAKAQKAQRHALATGKIPVVMDVDDYGFLLPGHDDLLNLKASLPNFKTTVFTIPFSKEFFNEQNAKHFKVEKYRQWANIVNELGWIEIALHGFAHTHHEMELTYDKAIEMLEATENLFDEIGLKYKKIYKAPYWQYSYDALVALRDKGYVVAIDRNHPRPTPAGLQTYIYNWSFEEQLPGDPIIKGHGHFTGKNTNNINDVLGNVLHYLPRTTEFIFISEYIEKYGNKAL